MATCKFPILLKNKSFGFDERLYGKESRLILVPCGKCVNCLKRRRQEWLFRLEQEALDSRHTMFITLSYAEEHCDYELHKEALINFIRRVREHYGKIKYYAIGEYGGKTKRPHYHALLFFKEQLNEDFRFTIRNFRKLWPYGNITLSFATARRLNYICHYHVRPKQVKGREQRTFSIQSKGIGLSFLNDKVLDYLNHSDSNLVYNKNMKSVPLPRYYRKKYDIPPKEFAPRIDKESLYEYCHRTHTDIEAYKDDLRWLDKQEFEKYNRQESF